jgi:hypothetical protein
MFQRDRERLKDCLKRVNVLPLGSAALAGTSFPINRKYVAQLLGFEAVGANSMDGVSDRDFAAEYLAAAALFAMHLSRLAEELVVWSSAEFGFVRMDDQFTSGSSIMPQKRNPDVAEIIRGKTGRVYGDLTALLTILKGIPLTYNRDLQEDKPPVFDAADTVNLCAEVMAGMLASVEPVPSAMIMATERGFLAATVIWLASLPLVWQVLVPGDRWWYASAGAMLAPLGSTGSAVVLKGTWAAIRVLGALAGVLSAYFAACRLRGGLLDAFAWIGRRTLGVYASHGYLLLLPVTALALAPRAVPQPWARVLGVLGAQPQQVVHGSLHARGRGESAGNVGIERRIARHGKFEDREPVLGRVGRVHREARAAIAIVGPPERGDARAP